MKETKVEELTSLAHPVGYITRDGKLYLIEQTLDNPYAHISMAGEIKRMYPEYGGCSGWPERALEEAGVLKVHGSTVYYYADDDLLPTTEQIASLKEYAKVHGWQGSVNINCAESYTKYTALGQMDEIQIKETFIL